MKSQSQSGAVYDVDSQEETCSCDFYHVNSYCKHVYAVLHLFFNRRASHFDLSDLSATTTPNTANIPQDSTDRRSESASSATVARTTTALSTKTSDPLGTIMTADQLLCSKLILKMAQSPDTLAKLLHEELATINSILNRHLDPKVKQKVLPAKEILPPNLTSASETAAAYNGTRKRVLPSPKKRKRDPEIANDPYSGGERSGKLAKTSSNAPQSLSQADIR